MALRLYNTMSARVEEFHPIQPKEVRMYACGPTVYDYGHIGNFRTFIAVDLLHRFLKQSGYQVKTSAVGIPGLMFSPSAVGNGKQSPRTSPRWSGQPMKLGASNQPAASQ